MSQNIILQYDGKLNQSIITSNMEIIENNIENMGIMGKVATISVELSQNMMTYSKTKDLSCREIEPYGEIQVTEKENIYYIKSKNIISKEDRARIEPRLLEIKSLDASGIKKRYKELRRSGENAHDNNGGIGFFEIAKQTTNLDFEFIEINEEKFYFVLKAAVEPRKK